MTGKCGRDVRRRERDLDDVDGWRMGWDIHLSPVDLEVWGTALAKHGMVCSIENASGDSVVCI